MKTTTKKLVRIAFIAAMYAALTYAQNFILPGTTSAAVQFRASEALNVLALFMPEAIPGLTIGCILSMLMPALWNGVIIGWEIECFFIDGPFHFASFLTQAGFVALGELGVMLILGTILYYTIVKRNLDKKIK